MKTNDELFEEGSLLVRDYDGHEQMLMNKGTFIAIMEEYASQFRQTLPKLFDIDFDGCVMARIEIINNIPVVTMAMNGYGNPINRDSIRINPLPSAPEKGGEE